MAIDSEIEGGNGWWRWNGTEVCIGHPMLFGVPRTNAPNTLSAQGGLPSGLSKYANWCLQVYVLVWVVCTLSTDCRETCC